jgi:RHS repeat-associated protein
VTRTTYPDGLVGTFIHDFEGRPLSANFSGGSSLPLTETFTYGPWGELLTYSNGAVSLAWTYDVLRRPITETNSLTGAVTTYEYTTDIGERSVLGRLATVRAGNGTSTEYQYDSLNRVRSIRQGAEVADIAYDSLDRVVQRRLPGGVVTDYTYDADGRLQSVAHRDPSGVVLLSRSYARDALGSVVEAVDEAGQRTTYEYDARSQLVRVNLPGGTTMTYTYDGAGNRLTMVDASGATTTYAYDADNQLLTDGRETFGYDARGNLVRRDGASGTTNLAYDPRNRLVRVTLAGGQQIDYVYGIGARRLERRTSTEVVRYEYARDELLTEYDGVNTVSRSYIPGDLGYAELDDGIGFRTATGDVFSSLRDGSGSLIGVASVAGGLIASYAYDPFGQVTAQAGQTGISTLRFQARPLEAATGTLDFRFREYDPRLGRFLAADPIGGVDRLYDYVFVGNNPQSRRDPFGLFSVDSSCSAADKAKLESCAQDVRNTINNPPAKCFVGKELGKKLLKAIDDAALGCYSATDPKCSGANAGVGAWGGVGGNNIWFCPFGLSYSYGGQSSLCPMLMHELVHNTGERDEDVAHGCERRCYEGRGGYPEGGGTQSCKDCK